jgi:hypothetical protein
LSEDTIPFSSDSDFVDETEEDELESLTETEEADLSDPERVVIMEEDVEVVTDDGEIYVSGPKISNKPDEKLTKEYEKKLIKELLHREL